MKQPLIVFRCDAGPVHGTGHVRRCLSLARVFRNAGWRAVFMTDLASPEYVPELEAQGDDLLLINGDDPVDEQAMHLLAPESEGVQVLVADNYELDARFERACRPMTDVLVALDDLADRPRDADVLFDSALGREASDYAGLLPESCRVVTGPGVALLAPDFMEMRATSLLRRETPGLERIMISLGGVDPGPVLERLVDGLALGGFQGWLTVVLGQELEVATRLRARSGDPFKLEVSVGVRDMAQRLFMTDLAIGAGGSSAWERCALGVPSLVVVTAHNQDFIARGLAEAGAVQLLGWHEDVTADSVAAAFRNLADDPAGLAKFSQNSADLCDGRGGERTWLSCLEEVVHAGLVTLRLATQADEDIVLAWQNAPQTRRYAHSVVVLTREEHHAWFAARLTDPDCLLCIITCDGQDAGSLRLDRKGTGSDRIVSIYLAPEAYGGGVATAALTLAQRLAPGWRMLAEVLAENEPSHRLFQRAGFRSDGEGTYIWEAAA